MKENGTGRARLQEPQNKGRESQKQTKSKRGREGENRWKQKGREEQKVYSRLCLFIFVSSLPSLFVAEKGEVAVKRLKSKEDGEAVEY